MKGTPCSEALALKAVDLSLTPAPGHLPNVSCHFCVLHTLIKAAVAKKKQNVLFMFRVTMLLFNLVFHIFVEKNCAN